MPITKFSKHDASDDASKQPIYSAFIVENATILCFILLQDTTPPAKRKVYSEVDFLVFSHPVQSESGYPINFKQSKWL